MNYHPDDFLNLMAAVESDGGEHVQAPHLPTAYQLEFTSARGKKKDRTFHTTGCGQEAQFDIPYDNGKDETATVRVCAVDDNVGAWPRFAGAVSERSTS